MGLTASYQFVATHNCAALDRDGFVLKKTRGQWTEQDGKFNISLILMAQDSLGTPAYREA